MVEPIAETQLVIRRRDRSGQNLVIRIYAPEIHEHDSSCMIVFEGAVNQTHNITGKNVFDALTLAIRCAREMLLAEETDHGAVITTSSSESAFDWRSPGALSTATLFGRSTHWASTLWQCKDTGYSEWDRGDDDEYPNTVLPDAMTGDLVAAMSDPEMAEICYDFVLRVLHRKDETGWKWWEIARSLPRGLRIVYTVSIVSGEVSNGGFFQCLGNRNLPDETLEDLHLIGAIRQAELVQQAIHIDRELAERFPQTWQRTGSEACPIGTADPQSFRDAMERIYQPKLDVLDTAWAELEDERPDPWCLMVEWMRANLDACEYSL